MKLKSSPAHLALIAVISLLTLGIAGTAYASPLYTPGQTLNPDCLPTNSDCTVATSTVSLTTANVFTNTNTFNGAVTANAGITTNTLSVGSLSGLLFGTNGVVSAISTSSLNLTIPLASTTGTLGISNGGTGTSTAPTYGKLLVGNVNGGYDLLATSTLNITATGFSGTTDALTQGSTNKFYADSLVNSYISGSSTIAKLYTANAWNALQTFGNNISLGGAQLNMSALAYGNLMSYNGTNWVNVATSSLNLSIPLASTTGTLGVVNGGTGASTFGQGWIYSNGGTGSLSASTSPTVNRLIATSTTLASILPYASTTALTVSGIGYFGTASTTNAYISNLASRASCSRIRTDHRYYPSMRMATSRSMAMSVAMARSASVSL
jgi:hypothetical protein